jgi:hypothetical protein
MHESFYLENLKGRDSFGKLSIDRRIILKWIVKKQVVKM